MNFGNIWNDIKMAMGKPVSISNVRSGRTFGKNEGSYVGGSVDIGDTSKQTGGTYVSNAVNSTAIQSIDFDPKANEAQIQYTGGTKKYTFPMTKTEFKAFQAAPSKGRWVAYEARRY